MYEEKRSFDVLNGTIPEFSNSDITLAITLNGKKVNGTYFPNKEDGFTKNKVSCEDSITADWDETSWGLTNIQNPNHVSKIKCTIDFSAPKLSEYLIKRATTVQYGESGFIKQEHDATEQTQSNATTDYRFIGANPNNYICLEDGQCTEDNLYRIIGVIPTQKENSESYEPMVKLVKTTPYVGSTSIECNYSNWGKCYYWSGSADNSSNDWTQSALNTEVLNNEYWNRIQNYQKYIEKTKWYLGLSKDNYPKQLYVNERKNGKSTFNNIALFYASDYTFATSGGNTNSREYCLTQHANTGWLSNENKNSNDCGMNNWIMNRAYEIWTLTASENTSEDNAKRVYAIAYLGNIYDGSSKVNSYKLKVFPSFYLKSNVLFLNGDGTHDNPYRITIS